MKFAIYKYELVKTNTKELFQENSAKISRIAKNERFTSVSPQ